MPCMSNFDQDHLEERFHSQKLSFRAPQFTRKNKMMARMKKCKKEKKKLFNVQERSSGGNKKVTDVPLT